MTVTVASLRIENEAATGAPIFIIDGPEGAVTVEAEDAASVAAAVDSAAGDVEHTAERTVRQAVVDAHRVRVEAVRKKIEELEAVLRAELEQADAAEEALAAIGGKSAPPKARRGRGGGAGRGRGSLTVVSGEPSASVAEETPEQPDPEPEPAPEPEVPVDEPPTFGTSSDDDLEF